MPFCARTSPFTATMPATACGGERILRLHSQGWTPSRIARELNYWRKPRLFPPHNEWSAIGLRVVIAVAGDAELRRYLVATPLVA